MFHKLITKYGLATHLALLASLPLVLMPFLSERALGVTILWLSAFSVLWLSLEPSIRSGEHLSTARDRVRSSLVRDPLFWFFLLVLAFAAVRWANSGIAMRYDPEQGAWMVKPPAAEMFPASVGEAGFLPFCVVVGVFALSMGLLHGAGLAARLSFGLQTAFILGIGGLVSAGYVCFEDKAFVARAAAGFLKGPFYGSFFGFGLVLAIVCGIQAEARKWTSSRVPFCLAVAGNAAGLMFFAPSLLAVAYFIPSLLFAMFGIVYLSRVGSLGSVARSSILLLFGIALAVCLLLAAVPDEVSASKTQGFDVAQAFPEIYRQLGDALSRIARTMWQNAPWCGAGVGAFGLQVPFIAEKADWTILPPSVSAAMNGYWTVLAERGILGCVLLLGGAALLLAIWVRRLIGAVLFLRTRDDADSFLFACAPVVWTAPFMLIVFCVEAVFTSVFSLTVILFPVITSIALSAASFPRNPDAKSAQAASDQEN